MFASISATARLRAGLCGAALLLPLAASATSMDAALVSLGSTAYRFDYRLINDGSLGSGARIDSFDIGFLNALVTGWTEIGASPDAWIEYSSPVLGDDLFGADLNQGGGIAVGDWADFSVSFDWGGAGLPGSQLFTIYDPISFAILETGQTSVTDAPSPATVLLMTPLLALVAVRRRRKPAGMGRSPLPV